MNFPECISEDSKHVWGKWEVFTKSNTIYNGLYQTVTTTSQKRQCEKCGLTQFLDEAQE